MAKSLAKSDDDGPAMFRLNEQQQAICHDIADDPALQFHAGCARGRYSDKPGGCKIRGLAPRYQLVRRLVGIATLA
jgi:hypothetical protein